MTATENRLVQLADEQLDLGHSADLDRTFADSGVSSVDTVSFLRVVAQEFNLSIAGRRLRRRVYPCAIWPPWSTNTPADAAGAPAPRGIGRAASPAGNDVANHCDPVTFERVWEVPEPASALEVRLDADTRTVLRRHGNPGRPRLVLSHGNGLAIDLYYPFWSLLAADFDLFVYDLRNHGWNSVGPRAAHNVPTLVRDHDLIIEAIDSHFDPRPRMGVFHSFSRTDDAHVNGWQPRLRRMRALRSAGVQARPQPDAVRRRRRSQRGHSAATDGAVRVRN